MNNIPDNVAFELLLSTLENSNDLSEIKTLCSIDKQFLRVCSNDNLWYQLYRLIDPRVSFNSPYYGTWRDTLLEGRTVFTTDRLISEGVKEMVNEFDDLVRAAGVDPNTIINDFTTMIMDHLKQLALDEKEFVHKFQAFWWISAEIHLHLSTLLTQLNQYLTERNIFAYNVRGSDPILSGEDLDNMIINPYGKLYFNVRYTNWHLRSFWSKYGPPLAE